MGNVATHLRSWERSLSTAICAFFGARFPHVTTPQRTITPHHTRIPQQAQMLLQTQMLLQVRMRPQARIPIKRVSFRPLCNAGSHPFPVMPPRTHTRNHSHSFPQPLALAPAPAPATTRIRSRTRRRPVTFPIFLDINSSFSKL